MLFFCKDGDALDVCTQLSNPDMTKSQKVFQAKCSLLHISKGQIIYIVSKRSTRNICKKTRAFHMYLMAH